MEFLHKIFTASPIIALFLSCLLYTSDAADDSVLV